MWKYKLAPISPDGSATYDEIAATSRISRPLVARTIRATMALNISDETESGWIRHAAISRLLATGEGYYNAIGLQLEDIGPASMRLIKTWEKFGHDAGEPDKSAFSVQDTCSGQSLFTVLAEEPERARGFDSTMKHCVDEKDFSFSDASRAFDWSVIDIPGSRVVDHGGGYGQLSGALAKQTRHLSFTVQDLPHVVEQGLEKLPSEFGDRITF